MKKRNLIESGSFLIGSLVGGLLSASLVVTFFDKLSLLSNISDLVIFAFALVFFLAFFYFLFRGKIGSLLFGSTAGSTDLSVPESLQRVFDRSNNSREDRKKAVHHLWSIYGDYQIRKTIVLTSIVLVGAITAFTSIAFLVRQTQAVETQTDRMTEQTKLLLTQTESLKSQVELQADQFEATIELSKLESVYKPYWVLMHSEDSEEKNKAFLSLLGGVTRNFSGLNIIGFYQRMLSGLRIDNFQCNNCDLEDIVFSGIEWHSPSFHDALFRSVAFNGGSIKDAVFKVSAFQSSSYAPDDPGSEADQPPVLFANIELNNVHFDKSELEKQILINVNILGGSFRDMTMKNVTFERVLIDGQEPEIALMDIFDGSVFDGVTFVDSELRDIDFTQATICGNVRFINTKFSNVLMSEHDRDMLIVEQGPDSEGEISWYEAGSIPPLKICK